MDRDYKRAILELLLNSFPPGHQMDGGGLLPARRAHKTNLIGRPIQRGEIELHTDVTFTDEDRIRAARCFDELRRDGYVVPTYDDLVDPENWVVITDSGRDFLARDLRDEIDEGLIAIGQHLPELRRGMMDAIERTSADAPRQAANGARELIDQILREGAPNNLGTRKERFKYLMQSQHGTEAVSKTNLAVLEASAELIEAEHNKMVKEAHARYSPTPRDARACVDAAERILELIFVA